MRELTRASLRLTAKPNERETPEEGGREGRKRIYHFAMYLDNVCEISSCDSCDTGRKGEVRLTKDGVRELNPA
ncbi:hypothetical protein JD844_004556 [Phrynosoma platyrhinos]|uniref:Uncharacterized protein n=1 Tax=Phrynosoma platyrhinos TaxID=52577 RepID=A0ABQ7SDI1_PHRPL|nr:hypothetical protein JD844_004556 [Phrynosoma platyrhinos]